jgi:hypothetical protein
MILPGSASPAGHRSETGFRHYTKVPRTRGSDLLDLVYCRAKEVAGDEDRVAQRSGPKPRLVPAGTTVPTHLRHLGTSCNEPGRRGRRWCNVSPSGIRVPAARSAASHHLRDATFQHTCATSARAATSRGVAVEGGVTFRPLESVCPPLAPPPATICATRRLPICATSKGVNRRDAAGTNFATVLSECRPLCAFAPWRETLPNSSVPSPGSFSLFTFHFAICNFQFAICNRSSALRPTFTPLDFGASRSRGRLCRATPSRGVSTPSGERCGLGTCSSRATLWGSAAGRVVRAGSQ